MQNSQALGAPPSDPRASGGWGLCPQTPITTPQLRISDYALVALCTIYNHMRFLSICFEQVFLHRSVASLIMLAIDVC